MDNAQYQQEGQYDQMQGYMPQFGEMNDPNMDQYQQDPNAMQQMEMGEADGQQEEEGKLLLSSNEYSRETMVVGFPINRGCSTIAKRRSYCHLNWCIACDIRRSFL